MTLQMGLLMKFGGSSVKDTVKRVMSHLFTNRAMSLMSLHGRSLGKLAFQDTPVFAALSLVCTRFGATVNAFAFTQL